MLRGPIHLKEKEKGSEEKKKENEGTEGAEVRIGRSASDIPRNTECFENAEVEDD